MQKKSMAMMMIACLLLLPIMSLAPSVGKVFLGTAWIANCSDRNDNAYFGLGAILTDGIYAGIATAVGVTSAPVLIGIGVGIAL